MMKVAVMMVMMVMGSWSTVSGQFLQVGQMFRGVPYASNANQGNSVSMSADGNWFATGAPLANQVGVVYVYVRNSTDQWEQQAIVPASSSTVINFGTSVALSANGGILAVGAPCAVVNGGGVFVCKRAGATWTCPQAPLPATTSNSLNTNTPGTSVAISDDGSVVAFGNSIDDSSNGAIWAFRLNSSGHYQQVGGKITADSSFDFGSSIALNSDGSLIAVGGPYSYNNAGGTWIFALNSSSLYEQQGGRILGTGASGLACQGSSVALSSDGGVLIVGGPGDKNFTGAVWVFQQTANGVWTQLGNKLVGQGFNTSNPGYMTQGTSVSISKNAAVFAVGALNYNNYQGATWVFVWNAVNSTYQQLNNKLIGIEANNTDPNFGSFQGRSVSLDGVGQNLIIGAPYYDSGGAWLFTDTAFTYSPSIAPTMQPTQGTISPSFAPTTKPVTSNSGSKNKSKGEVAGIVIGVLIGLVVVGAIIWYFMEQPVKSHAYAPLKSSLLDELTD